MSNVRFMAAGVLVQVLEGQSLDDALVPVLARVAQRDQSFLRALCFHSLRYYHRLDFILSQLLKKPLKDTQIRALALIGLTQLAYMDVKPYAAVAETVAAAGRKHWARPLLNALLRNYQRRRQALEAAADGDFEASLSHPAWLRQRIERTWPGQALPILEENNRQAPMVLRINLRRCDRERYLEHLQAGGIIAHPLEAVPSAVVLERPQPVTELPGFAEGWVSVQDGAAQLAAPLLDVQPGMRVLDVCSAPGGKAQHVLETCPGVDELVALDISQARLARVGENIARFGQAPLRLICGDARNTGDWWDGRQFERILVDAPCSGTGVIRRHPDIKLLRRDQDIGALTSIQGEILEAVWPLLKEGGVLLYATCSILPEENARQLHDFIQSHRNAHRMPIEAAWGFPVAEGRQILPGVMDGFYYAKVLKCAT